MDTNGGPRAGGSVPGPTVPPVPAVGLCPDSSRCRRGHPVENFPPLVGFKRLFRSPGRDLAPRAGRGGGEVGAQKNAAGSACGMDRGARIRPFSFAFPRLPA